MPASSSLAVQLLAWYRRKARDLPWRRTSDPYAIWISEIMLQQTQVDTVIPYYERWLKHFPTVKKLAAANQEEVMKFWAGLGYYRRARMLHEAAKKIAAEFKGRLPATAAELIKLPGIGRYTAGAIASIAFGEKTPVLDGNVIRILTRIFAISKDVQSPAAIKELWDIAAGLVPQKNPGDFNQAMMELGATVCFPENPQCGVCPVQKSCKAHALGSETDFPFKGRREKLEKIRTAALVLRRNGSVLLKKQGTHERWGGLWMFPHWPSKKAMLTESRLEAGRIRKRMSVRHGFTKYQVTLEVFEMKAAEETNSYAVRGTQHETKWVAIGELAHHPLPSPHRKIAHDLAESND